MGKAIPGAAISQVVPTDEEREAARQKRLNMTDKEKASAKTTVRQFLGKFPDEEAKKMRGSDDLLELFMVHTSRAKAATKNITNDRVISRDKKKHEELHWYGKENGRTTFGEQRWDHWQESGLMPQRAC